VKKIVVFSTGRMGGPSRQRSQKECRTLFRSADRMPGPGGHFAAWEQPALHAKEIATASPRCADLGKLTCRMRI
jgi:hypothetical protein